MKMVVHPSSRQCWFTLQKGSSPPQCIAMIRARAPRRRSLFPLFVLAILAPAALGASAAVPYLVRDLAPERQQVDARIDFARQVVGDVFYFGTIDIAEGLWRTDGTATGTYRVIDDAPGLHSRLWQPMLDLGGTLYYPVG